MIPRPIAPYPQPAEFYIDASICMSCSLCAEFCPFDAIKMDHDYELSSFERFNTLVFDKARLTKPDTYHAAIHPTDWAARDCKRRKKPRRRKPRRPPQPPPRKRRPMRPPRPKQLRLPSRQTRPSPLRKTQPRKRKRRSRRVHRARAVLLSSVARRLVSILVDRCDAMIDESQCSDESTDLPTHQSDQVLISET